MFETIRELLRLAAKSRKIWLLPIVLFMVIAALLLAASRAPQPVFIYPIL